MSVPKIDKVPKTIASGSELVNQLSAERPMAVLARRSLATVILNGRPPFLPRARAEANPASVRSEISSRGEYPAPQAIELHGPCLVWRCGMDIVVQARRRSWPATSSSHRSPPTKAADGLGKRNRLATKMKYVKRFSSFSSPRYIGVCLGVCWATCEAVDTNFKTDKRGFDDLHRCRKPLRLHPLSPRGA